MVTESPDSIKGLTGEESASQNEILLKSGETEVRVLPLGAMISSFKVGDVEVLFPDQNITTDKGKKRRGGIPLLWPQAGPLTEESEEFKLPQHGFARDLEWEVVDVSDGSDEVTLKLKSNEDTRNKFPYDFELIYKIKVTESNLRMELQITNNSENNLPMAPGFHPYFNIPVNNKPNISTNINGFNPSEYDWKTSQVYEIPSETIISHSNGEIDIQASTEMKTMVIWSEPERDHVCFEPWTGDVNALLDPNTRIEVAPNESKTLSLQIKYQKNN